MAAYLYIRGGPNAGEIHHLGLEPRIVGRGSECEIRLLDPSVSRNHFRLECRKGKHWLVDSGSRNGIEINGNKVVKRELQAGDEIVIGASRMEFVPALPSGLPANDELAGAATDTFDVVHSERMLGVSTSMRKVQEQIEKVAPLDVTVLITGESGTGKELVAAAIHQASSRLAGPMIPVNCAAIPGELVESELFGHEKGAFTSAQERRLGKFELARGGTLFLDEVAELPLDAQAKFLRVLESRRMSRVGGEEEIEVDVRILAATNRDLHRLAKEERFRADLLYRLEVVRIEMPPLRKRREDVLPLAEHFLKRVCLRFGREMLSFSPTASELLRKHSWPGNVRELKNAVERASIFASGFEVMPDDLQLSLEKDDSETHPSLRPTRQLKRPARGFKPDESGVAPIDEVVRQQIEEALERSRGNKKKAAEMLGISRSSLYNYLDRFGLRKPPKRRSQ